MTKAMDITQLATKEPQRLLKPSREFNPRPVWKQDLGQLAQHHPKAAEAIRKAQEADGPGKSELSEDAKMWKAAQDFEAMFLGQMMKSMRKTVNEGSEFTEKSPGRDMFTDMLDQEYAKLSSKQSSGGINGVEKAIQGTSTGLAAQIYRSMKRNDQDSIPALQNLKSPMNQSIQQGLFDLMGTNNSNALDLETTQFSLPTSRNTPKKPGKSGPLPDALLEPIVNKAAATFQVDSNLIRSVITQESGRNPHAQSKAGAKGLMQLMDGTASDLGVKDVWNPEENVMAGTKYLKQLLNRFGGNESLALAGYNAGPERVARSGGIPNIEETRNYVDSVLANRRVLANRSR